MGHGYRWWYRLTGVPGWLRRASSPDLLGHSPYGFGPPARPVMDGTWSALQTDYFRHALLSAQMHYYPIPGFLAPYDLYGAVQVTSEQALNYLKKQAEVLEDELVAIREQMKQLENDNDRR